MGQPGKIVQEVEEELLELKKTQERIMIKALVIATKAEVHAKGESLIDKLEMLAAAAASQTTAKVSASIESALQGQAADAAKSKAGSLPSPEFRNPVN
ncbi:hypothetical protein ACVR0S_09755 [Streptococcus dentapri]|uniref:Phage protein n=1 Tax=Streptococcus dentapri TaxID=573564 RepID=A0ABV8D3K3_9STRE